jgi:L-lactate dehydrogenase (cytochrome)
MTVITCVEDLRALSRRRVPKMFHDYEIPAARAAGRQVLVLTLDLPVMGQRHRDIRNGLSTPDLMAKPGWCRRMLATRRRTEQVRSGHLS